MESAMDRRTAMMGLALAGSGALTTAAAAQSGVENPLIAAFGKTLSAHDIDGFAALFADDYVNHQMSAAAPNPAPGVSAKQATVGFFAGRLKGMPDPRDKRGGPREAGLTLGTNFRKIRA
jgi:hypothetical protein